MIPNETLWITGHMAPYRIPIFDELSKFTKLTIYVLESDSHTLKTTLRGKDWLTKDLTTQNFVIDNIPAVRIDFYGKSIHYALLKLPKLSNYDAIVFGLGWDNPAAWQILAIAKMLKINCIGFYESTLESQNFNSHIFRHMRNRFYKLMDSVVVPGLMAEEAVYSMGVRKDRIFRGFNPVNNASIRRNCLEERKEDRKDDLHSKDNYQFVYVGQLINRKNIQSIIRALAQVECTKSVIHIIGKGPLDGEIERLAQNLGITNRVIFHGSVSYSRLPKILSGMNTLILASNTEVWGLVVNEALVCGLSVIVSARAGVSRDVAGMEGVYVLNPTEESLIQAMNLAISEWTGWIEKPEILRYTPERFAAVILNAMNEQS
jgi:glycosyltransferase involved in cell wall biosynthesis